MRGVAGIKSILWILVILRRVYSVMGPILTFYLYLTLFCTSTFFSYFSACETSFVNSRLELLGQEPTMTEISNMHHIFTRHLNVSL